MFELASVGDLPLPRPSPSPSNKRERDGESASGSSDSPESYASPAGSNISNEEPAQRQFAGSKRAYQKAQANQATQQQQQQRQQQQQHPLPPQMEQLPQMSWRPENIIPSTMNVPPMPGPSFSHPGFAASLQNWFGYDTADASYGAVPVPPPMPQQQSIPPHTMQHQSGVAGHMSQPLDMGQMPSTQSMMYDQALSNLSASLSTSNIDGSQGPSAFAHAPHNIPPSGVPTPSDDLEDISELLAAFGQQYEAVFPEFADDGAFGFNSWPAAGQQQPAMGFDGWGTFGQPLGGGAPGYGNRGSGGG